MKHLCIAVVAFLACGLASAQTDFSKSLEGIDWVKIESRSTVRVHSQSGNQLTIKSGKAFERPKKAEGLKLIGEDGFDNTNVGFYVIKEGNNLIVRNLRKDEDAEIYLPAGQNVSVVSKWQGDIEVTGFTGAIEATAELNGGIDLKDVTGPVTANTLNGELNVTFTKVSQASPISISTINGDIDVTMPASTPANLALSTVNGSVYTNFDLHVPSSEGLSAIASRKVSGTINNGGVKIQLNTVNSNIYLRKK